MNKKIIAPILLGCTGFALSVIACAGQVSNQSVNAAKINIKEIIEGGGVTHGGKTPIHVTPVVKDDGPIVTINPSEHIIAKDESILYRKSIINVSNLGRGFNAAVKDSRAYDDEVKTKLDANIFDQDWLENQYKKIICDGDSYEKSYNGYSYDTKAITESISVGFEEMTELTAGYACLEASVGLGFEQDFSFSTTQITSNFFTKSVLKRKITDCALPNAVDFDTYSQNLDSGFLSNVNDYYAGTKSAEEFFNFYGTHILTEASYGGVYEFNSILSSTEFSFETAVTNKVKESIGAKISYAGASVGIKETFTQSLTQGYGVAAQNITYDGRGHVYGGDTTISKEYLDDMIAFRDEKSSEWAASVDKNPIILEYVNAHPIYRYLPKDLYTSEQIEKMKNDLEVYMAKAQIGVEGGVFDMAYCGDSATVKNTYATRTFGNYWDRADNYVIQQDVIGDDDDDDCLINNANYDLYKKAGVTKVQYTFNCKMKETQDKNHNQYVKIEFDNGSSTNTVLCDKSFNVEPNAWKNVSITGEMDFNAENFTDLTTFNITLYDKTGANWIFNEPITQAKDVNFSLKFIIG